MLYLIKSFSEIKRQIVKNFILFRTAVACFPGLTIGPESHASAKLHKNQWQHLGVMNKSLGKTPLESGGEKDYNPPRTQGKEATENMDGIKNAAVFGPEQASRFPNLLEDEDFAFYYWTLPFCNL